MMQVRAEMKGGEKVRTKDAGRRGRREEREERKVREEKEEGGSGFTFRAC
jgi:hypothetical protein